MELKMLPHHPVHKFSQEPLTMIRHGISYFTHLIPAMNMLNKTLFVFLISIFILGCTFWYGMLTVTDHFRETSLKAAMSHAQMIQIMIQDKIISFQEEQFFLGKNSKFIYKTDTTQILSSLEKMYFDKTEHDMSFFIFTGDDASKNNNQRTIVFDSMGALKGKSLQWLINQSTGQLIVDELLNLEKGKIHHYSGEEQGLILKKGYAFVLSLPEVDWHLTFLMQDREFEIPAINLRNTLIFITFPVVFVLISVLLRFTLSKVRLFQMLERSRSQLQEAYEQLKVTKIQLAETEKIAEMTQTFQRFVPQQFLQKIGSSLDNALEVKSVEEKMTLIFSDIRSYTSISEKMNVEENFRFLNEYLSVMEPVITENRGFIDKFIGDGILALFDGTSSAEYALQAAIKMQRELNSFNQRVPFAQNIRVGIGINTGVVKVGLVGTRNRMDSTVIGDPVNLAARLESLTKTYKADILISESTYQEINQEAYLIREVDRVKVHGRETPVTIYEVFDSNSPEIVEKKIKTLADLHTGIILYRERNFQEAKEIFQKCQSIYVEDYLTSEYIQRCNYFIKYPPHTNTWDGVIQNTHYHLSQIKRRRAPRFDLQLPLSVSLYSLQETIQEESLDISPVGIKMSSCYDFQVGSIIDLVIDFSQHTVGDDENVHAINLTGQVTWTRRITTIDEPVHYQIGVEFIMLTSDQEKQLQQELWRLSSGMSHTMKPSSYGSIITN
ncbi:MAG: PilZ domain-containing protein [SAR324 cluster bacterium]|nr:PilZ domain-containing protein [SAR324 cluster bacterium]